VAKNPFDDIRVALALIWDDVTNRLGRLLKRIVSVAIPKILRGVVRPFPNPGSSGVVALDLVSDILDAIGDAVSSVSVAVVLGIAEAYVLAWEPPKRYNSKVTTVGDALRQGLLIWLTRARGEVTSPNSESVAIIASTWSASGIRSKLEKLFKGDLTGYLGSRLKSLVRGWLFIILQIIIIVGKIGLAVATATIAINTIKDASKDKGIIEFFALRQNKPRKRAKGIRRTREVVSQKH